MQSEQTIIFFGTSKLSVIALDTLKARGIIPAYIVTTPDRPQGRKMLVTPSPAKVWAQENNIPVLQYEKLSKEYTSSDETGTQKIINAVEELKQIHPILFIVASYGKIIPQSVLDIPVHGSLNIHPSLLPKYRGPSPIPSAILADDRDTGVTIMLMDALMDHGPIIVQKKSVLTTSKWPVYFSELEHELSEMGANAIADILPDFLQDNGNGKIEQVVQDESLATITRKITKEDGKLDFTLNPDGSITNTSAEQYISYLKICAYEGWPGTYFFTTRKEKEIRVAIKEAEFVGDKMDGKLMLKRVTPEGGKEMNFADFCKGL